MTTLDAQMLATITGGGRFADGCRYGLAYERLDGGTSTWGRIIACVAGGLHEVTDSKATHGWLKAR